MSSGFSSLMRPGAKSLISFFNEYQLLAMLSLACIFLSLASWLTTLGGIWNFTREYATCILVATGLQLTMVALALKLGGALATSDGRAKSPAQTVWTIVVTLAALAYLLFKFQSYSALAINGLDLLANIIAVIAVMVVLLTPRNALITLPFMLAMGISIIFSFDSLYSTFSPPEKRLRGAVGAATTASAKIVETLGNELREDINRRSSSILQSEAGAKFKQRIEAVAAAADLAKVEVAEASQTQAVEAQTRLSKRTGFNETVQKAEPEIERITRDIKQKEKELTEAEADIDKPRQDMEKAAQELDERKTLIARETEGKRGKGKGCGEACEALKRGDPAAGTPELKTLERQATDTRARYDVKAGPLEKLKVDIKALTVKLAQKTKERDDAKGGLRIVGEGSSAPDIRPEAITSGELSAAMQTFTAGPDRARLEAMVNRCKTLLETLRSVKKAGALTCEPEGFLSESEKLFARKAALEKYNEKCTIETLRNQLKPPGNAAPAQTEDLERTAIFERLVGKARECVAVSTLDATQVETHYATITSLENGVDPRSGNRLAANAFAFEQRDTTAYLVALIAFSLDGLVLVVGIYLARALASSLTRRDTPTPEESDATARAVLGVDLTPDVNDPPAIRNAKTFLKNLHPRDQISPGNDTNYPEEIDFEAVEEEERDQIKQAMRLVPETTFVGPQDEADQIQNGFRWILRDKSGRAKVHIRLIHYLSEIIAKHQREHGGTVKRGFFDRMLGGAKRGGRLQPGSDETDSGLPNRSDSKRSVPHAPGRPVNLKRPV